MQSCCPVATKAFACTVAGPEGKVLSEQGIIVDTQISYKAAHERLNDFDVMVVVGGNTDATLTSKSEPLPLIKAYSELQQKDSARERTLLSICTGSLFLAEVGILSGLSATTHPDYMTAFENICSHSAVRDAQERTDVDEEARYVVNNLRFDIGDEDENPYVRRKADVAQSQDGRRSSNARYVLAPPLPVGHFCLYPLWREPSADFSAERAASRSRPRAVASPLCVVRPCAWVVFAPSRVGE